MKIRAYKNGAYRYDFKTLPYLHQYLYWRDRKDLIFDGCFFEMGCGKSKVIVDKAAYLFDTGKLDGLVILAPKGCYQDWKDSHVPENLPDRFDRKHVEWTSDPSKKLMDELRTIFTATPGRLNILSMNIEALLGAVPLKMIMYFLKHHRALLAIDESTTIGNPKAKRTKIVLNKLRDLAAYRCILTGDAAPNRPLTLWSQGEALTPEALGHASFMGFKSTYCHLVPMRGAGGRTFLSINTAEGEHGYRNLADLRERVSKIAFIVKKADCLDLPAKIYSKPRVIEMGPKQRNAYEQMRDQAVVYLNQHQEVLAENKDVSWEDINDSLAGVIWTCADCGQTSFLMGRCTFCGSHNVGVSQDALPNDRASAEVSSASLVLVQMLRLHQIACGFLVDDSGKEQGFDETNTRLEALLDVLEETSGKVAIWSCYRRNVIEIEKAIGERFGKETVRTYFGDTTDAARREAKLAFQDPKSPVRFFDANIATGKYGLTLTAGSTALYYADIYDREARIQSEDRLHRIGQVNHVNYLDFVARGTVDEEFLPIRLGKEELSKLVTPSNWKKVFAGGRKAA